MKSLFSSFLLFFVGELVVFVRLFFQFIFLFGFHRIYVFRASLLTLIHFIGLVGSFPAASASPTTSASTSGESIFILVALAIGVSGLLLRLRAPVWV